MRVSTAARALGAAALVAALSAVPVAAQEVDWSLIFGEMFPEEATATDSAAAQKAKQAEKPPPAPAQAASPKLSAQESSRGTGQRVAARGAQKASAVRRAPPRRPVSGAAAGKEMVAVRSSQAADQPPKRGGATASHKPPTPAQVARLAVRPPAPPVQRRAEPPAAREAAPAPRQAAPAALSALARYGLKPGDVITDANYRQYSELLTPGMEWAIVNGWRMEVVEPRRVEMPRYYREATEKYSAQVRLGPGGTSLVNYVAGQPFPNVDVNDPDAVYKLMWNFYYNYSVTDDVAFRFFDADSGTVGKNRAMDVERHYIIDAYRKLNYNGRLVVPPKPELPNPEGFRFKESLHPLLEPYDLKGVGGTFYRYLDPERHDDSWIYLPQLRRVRRLSTAQRSDALFGQDTDVDSYWGYNGHIAWMTYRLLGERTVLATMHGRHVPVKWQDPEDWAWEDVWEPRQVYVIEAKSKFSQYAFSKRVIYLDKEAWVITSTDLYDRAGQLWKVWMQYWSFKKQATPWTRLSRYEDEHPFGHALVMLDTQIAHATKASIPSPKTIGEESWYINMGDKVGTTEEFFTIAHLIQFGR